MWEKARGRTRRELSRRFSRRDVRLAPSRPLISFTFDDFPRNALTEGGRILAEKGARGTYYTAVGLMGLDYDTGKIFESSDLELLKEQGHELGCHTFAHCHSWTTPAREFEDSIQKNQRRLAELAPGGKCSTLSYPISQPHPSIKNRCAKYFAACRGGGQTFNIGQVDLNCLSSFFIEQSRDDFDQIQRVIEANRQAGGWLIFSTHDIAENPTRYGCTPELFARVLRAAVASGAELLTMSQALEVCGVTENQQPEILTQ
jgi:peptidoglycan/xylan/chitin deacetylase (PgdA/CDA1 family)